MTSDRAHFAHLYVAQEAAKNGLPATVSPDPAHQARSHADPSLSEPRAGSLSSKLVLPPPYERDVQAAIIELLERHPRVAWAYRMNTGAVERENEEGKKRFIKFAFKGCSPSR